MANAEIPDEAKQARSVVEAVLGGSIIGISCLAPPWWVV
tara:strand:+ start:18048 stop:18164 length:117 start_codon:yes stop_codon:yes gene_type:complete